MENNITTRPWDPTAPSLLWAHEIRRENIHLLNQLTTTQSDLSNTTHALSTLQQTVSALERTVQELRAQSDSHVHAEVEAKVEAEADAREALGRRVTELESGVDARFAEIGITIEGVRGDNKRLESVIDGVKGEWDEGLENAIGMQLGVIRRDMKDMIKAEVCMLVEEMVGREMEGVRCGGCGGCCCGRGILP